MDGCRYHYFLPGGSSLALLFSSTFKAGLGKTSKPPQLSTGVRRPGVALSGTTHDKLSGEATELFFFFSLKSCIFYLFFQVCQ